MIMVVQSLGNLMIHYFISLVWVTLLLPIIAAEYEEIKIRLVPRHHVDPRMVDNFTCGVDASIDSDRLIAEQNAAYLFDVFDNTNDNSELHRTEVFDVILVEVFNFLYNEGRGAASFNPGLDTNCRTPEETETSLRKNFNSDGASFERTEVEGRETAGFLKVDLRRDPTDLEFVNKFTRPNFRAKKFYTLKTRKSRLFSPAINSENASLSVIWASFG